MPVPVGSDWNGKYPGAGAVNKGKAPGRLAHSCATPWSRLYEVLTESSENNANKSIVLDVGPMVVKWRREGLLQLETVLAPRMMREDVISTVPQILTECANDHWMGVMSCRHSLNQKSKGTEALPLALSMPH